MGNDIMEKPESLLEKLHRENTALANERIKNSTNKKRVELEKILAKWGLLSKIITAKNACGDHVPSIYEYEPISWLMEVSVLHEIKNAHNDIVRNRNAHRDFVNDKNQQLTEAAQQISKQLLSVTLEPIIREQYEELPEEDKLESWITYRDRVCKDLSTLAKITSTARLGLENTQTEAKVPSKKLWRDYWFLKFVKKIEEHQGLKRTECEELALALWNVIVNKNKIPDGMATVRKNMRNRQKKLGIVKE